MQSYTIEINGSGEVTEGFFKNDDEAQIWAESVLETRGYDPDEIVCCDWNSDGINDDDEQCYCMLFWADETAAKNDSGVNAICKLCKVV